MEKKTLDHKFKTQGSFGLEMMSYHEYAFGLQLIGLNLQISLRFLGSWQVATDKLNVIYNKPLVKMLLDK